MKILALFLLTLALVAMSCNWQIKSAEATQTPEPTKTATATAKATKTPFPTPPNALGITGNVYVRKSPNSGDTALGVLNLGDSVTAECSDNWCKITDGYIWRGCTSNNPNALGCKEAK